MDPAQEGAYMRLLCYQWNSDTQSLPGDDASLARLSRLNERWAELGAGVRACFGEVAGTPGRIRNERLHACWIEAMEFRRLQHDKGVRSGQARREQRLNRGSTVVPTGRQPEANSESESESESDLKNDTHTGATLLDRLKATGKFPSLTAELLALKLRLYPRADTPAAHAELVEAARSMPGAIGSPAAWIDRTLQGIEARLTGRAKGGPALTLRQQAELEDAEKRKRRAAGNA